MNIKNIIIKTIILATATDQTNGQLVIQKRLAVVRKHLRALSEFGKEDSGFSDAAAGESGSMSMMHMISEDAAGGSGGKRAMIMYDSRSKWLTKSSKGSKGSKGSKVCPKQPQPTCALEMILAISQHPVQIDKVGDNEFMLVWTGLTDEGITVEFPGGCVCDGKVLAVGGGGAGGRGGGGGGAGGVLEFNMNNMTDFSSAFNVTFKVGRGGVGQSARHGEDGESTTATLLSQSLKAGGGGGGGACGPGDRDTGGNGENGTDPINLGGGGSGGGGSGRCLGARGGGGGYPGGNAGADGGSGTIDGGGGGGGAGEGAPGVVDSVGGHGGNGTAVPESFVSLIDLLHFDDLYLGGGGGGDGGRGSIGDGGIGGGGDGGNSGGNDCLLGKPMSGSGGGGGTAATGIGGCDGAQGFFALRLTIC